VSEHPSATNLPKDRTTNNLGSKIAKTPATASNIGIGLLEYEVTLRYLCKESATKFYLTPPPVAVPPLELRGRGEPMIALITGFTISFVARLMTG